MSYPTGTAGNDTITGIYTLQNVLGHLIPWPASEKLDGLAGDDSIDGNNGLDTLIGGDGDDTIIGGSIGDSIVGGTGSDVMTALDGGDYVDAGTGGGSADGGAGNDTLEADFAGLSFPGKGVSFDASRPEVYASKLAMWAIHPSRS